MTHLAPVKVISCSLYFFFICLRNTMNAFQSCIKVKAPPRLLASLPGSSILFKCCDTRWV